MSDRTRVASLCAFVLVAAVGAQEPPYSSREGNYRVTFPSAPKTAKQVLPGPGGAKITAYTTAAKDRDGAMYSVNYAEYATATEAMLDSAVDAMIKSARMRPVARKEFALDGHPGRDVRFEVDPPRGTKEKGVGQARCFLVGKRIYQVLVIGPESKLSADAMQAFVGSFALVKEVSPSAKTAVAAAPAAVVAAPMVDRAEPATVVDPDGDCEITRLRSGATIAVPAKVHDLSPVYQTYNAPRLMRDVEGDFVTEVRVFPLVAEAKALREGVPYRGAGLVYWQDKDHYLRFERASIVRDGNRHAFLFYAKAENGQEVSQGGVPLPDAAVTLKLERKGSRLLASFNDGARWQDLKPMDISSWPASGQVGVAAINATAKPLTARFEALKLRAAEVAAPAAGGAKTPR
jgi:regulation of enolase protein 1 (concanavalin A-like superfamily)